MEYLGWCVLGVQGCLVNEQRSTISDQDGRLTDRGTYEFVVDGEDTLADAIDPEVVKTRSKIPSASTNSRTNDFQEDILEQDGCCMWTGSSARNAIHIIPFARGSEVSSVSSFQRPYFSVATVHHSEPPSQ